MCVVGQAGHASCEDEKAIVRFAYENSLMSVELRLIGTVLGHRRVRDSSASSIVT